MADPFNAIVGGADPYAARLVGQRQSPAPGATGSQPSRPQVTIQMQEALEARRVSSALFSTLMTRDGRFLRAPSEEQAGASGLPGAPTGSKSLLATNPAAPGSRQARESWQRAAGWQSHQSASNVADSLASIRVAEGIIQAASAAPPSVEGRRIEAEAFLMEAQAQREFESQQAQGMAGRREWMA
jgi:hypothetical protein